MYLAARRYIELPDGVLASHLTPAINMELLSELSAEFGMSKFQSADFPSVVSRTQVRLASNRIGGYDAPEIVAGLFGRQPVDANKTWQSFFTSRDAKRGTEPKRKESIDRRRSQLKDLFTARRATRWFRLLTFVFVVRED